MTRSAQRRRLRPTDQPTRDERDEAAEFSASDRWDIVRFWDDDELVALGQKAPAVSRIDFIDDAHGTLAAILADFDDAKRDLKQLEEHSTTATFSLADTDRFLVRSGSRITNTQILEHPGTVPVYSCFTNSRSHKGTISADWLAEHNIRVEDKTIVTVIANGAKAVGRVFVREPNTVITDDVIAVAVLTDDVDLDYLAVALRSAIAAGGFVYEAKPFARRVRELEVQIPVIDGVADLGRQRTIAEAVKRFDSIRERLAELGSWSLEARIR